MHATHVIDAAVATSCAASAVHHGRLCPRQVLGVRLAHAAAAALALDSPRTDRRLLIVAETDGCFVDGVTAATGCTVGHRTLRIVDYGRVALTAIDVVSRQAIRAAPRAGVREAARRYTPDEPRRYHAQLQGYQMMPAAELVMLQTVQLRFDLDAVLGRRGQRTDCAKCGEEVMNGRETIVSDAPWCRACLAAPYYAPTD